MLSTHLRRGVPGSRLPGFKPPSGLRRKTAKSRSLNGSNNSILDSIINDKTKACKDIIKLHGIEIDTNVAKNVSVNDLIENVHDALITCRHDGDDLYKILNRFGVNLNIKTNLEILKLSFLLKSNSDVLFDIINATGFVLHEKQSRKTKKSKKSGIQRGGSAYIKLLMTIVIVGIVADIFVIIKLSDARNIVRINRQFQDRRMHLFGLLNPCPNDEVCLNQSGITVQYSLMGTLSGLLIPAIVCLLDLTKRLSRNKSRVASAIAAVNNPNADPIANASAIAAAEDKINSEDEDAALGVVVNNLVDALQRSGITNAGQDIIKGVHDAGRNRTAYVKKTIGAATVVGQVGLTLTPYSSLIPVLGATGRVGQYLYSNDQDVAQLPTVTANPDESPDASPDASPEANAAAAAAPAAANPVAAAKRRRNTHVWTINNGI